MKKSKLKLSKKLLLNKEMIAALGERNKDRIVGGATIGVCATINNPTHCQTNCNTVCPHQNCD